MSSTVCMPGGFVTRPGVGAVTDAPASDATVGEDADREGEAVIRGRSGAAETRRSLLVGQALRPAGSGPDVPHPHRLDEAPGVCEKRAVPVCRRRKSAWGFCEIRK